MTNIAKARTRYRSALYYLGVGLAGGLLAERLDVPGGMLVGAMATAAVAQLLGVDWGKPPTVLGLVGKVMLGTAVGSSFNRDVLARLGALLLPAIAAILGMIAAGIGLACLLSKWTGLEVSTALFSLTPGGVAEMVAISEQTDADTPVVATLQFLRLFGVVTLAPLFIHLLLS
jgi:membrane AbrB-like protein